MILLTKKKRKELASELALNITNYDEVIAEFKNKVDILTRERDAAKTNARDTTSKFERAMEELERVKSELRASEIEKDRLQNNYSELASKEINKRDKHKIEYLQETIAELNDRLEMTERFLIIDADYRETYELINDPDKKELVKECYSHNISNFLKANNMVDSELAKLTGYSRKQVQSLRTGINGPTVNNIQKMNKLLCNFYRCTVKSLVTEKLEVSK